MLTDGLHCNVQEGHPMHAGGDSRDASARGRWRIRREEAWYAAG